ncbi:MAG: OmpA family protein [Flavobacteriales bacterium]|jgi:outer membrane protein OmpA-like peptidoglycan-associated protein
MINLKNLALASLFVTTSAFAQDGGLKGLVLDNASIGVDVGAFRYVSADRNLDVAFGLNYTKQINSVFALQAGVLNGALSNEAEELAFNALTLKGLINLTNLSVGSSPKAKLYLSGGVNVLSFDDGNAVIPTLGAGIKYALYNNIDLDLSAAFGSTPLTSDPINTHLITNIGVNYKFTKKDVAIEWNNPLDAMYGDIATVKTEIEGLSTDTDGDGVADAFDGDNNTPEGVAVDGKGNALDVDMDGVADYADEDPFTARGVQVDANGRELDSDKDGVANSIDIEPNTESGATVNFQGKEIRGAKGAFMPAVYFDFNSAKVSYANYERLAAVASLLQANPKYKLSVIGYADAVGNSANNHKIALRRANAVVDALSSMFSIDASRLTASSKGEDAPLANESVKVTETTADGQVISNNLTRMNRRVEFVIE